MAKKKVGASTGFTSIQRTSPTTQVRDQLLAAIEAGAYPPGSMLPSERILCESFGVSRVSVREALAGLQSTGLIRVEHGRGAVVRESVNDAYAGPFGRYLKLHRAELVELLKVRGALDELAASEAAEHGTASGFRQMMAAADAFEEAARSANRDLERIAELDIAFHLSIAELGQGDLLPGLLSELNQVMTESRRMTLSRPGQLERSVTEHRSIAEAVAERDPARARRAVRRHLANVRKLVDEIVIAE
jgi:GntR family transcriptional repressor for pyruvate dehydrogenase complex